MLRRSSSIPLFDETFVNYGFNKVQWIEHLRYRGFEFFTSMQAFLVDIPHKKSWKWRHHTLGRNMHPSTFSAMVIWKCSTFTEPFCIGCRRNLIGAGNYCVYNNRLFVGFSVCSTFPTISFPPCEFNSPVFPPDSKTMTGSMCWSAKTPSTRRFRNPSVDTCSMHATERSGYATNIPYVSPS